MGRMTDDNKVREAIEWFREHAETPPIPGEEEHFGTLPIIEYEHGNVLADRVEELEREVERLRDAHQVVAGVGAAAIVSKSEAMEENAKLRAALQAVRDAYDAVPDGGFLWLNDHIRAVMSRIEGHVLPLTEGKP